MFCARVMIGNSLISPPNNSLKVPPPINSDKPNDLYDSIQGN